MFSNKYIKYCMFFLCLFLTLFYTIYPAAIGNKATGFNQLMLTFLMLGICFGFVYSTGFAPRFILWRLLFNPLSSLILIFVPIVMLYFYQK